MSLEATEWDRWDDYFLAVAEAVRTKSKDRSQVGAVLVRDRLILATGFNGMPRRVPDEVRLLQDAELREEKLKWICHAEQNAVCNAARLGVGTAGATAYVTKFPCFCCLQTLIQADVLMIATKDHAFWDHDPIDQTHDGKRYLIRTAQLAIKAPNFPDYAPPARPLLTTASSAPRRQSDSSQLLGFSSSRPAPPERT